MHIKDCHSFLMYRNSRSQLQDRKRSFNQNVYTVTSNVIGLR